MSTVPLVKDVMSKRLVTLSPDMEIDAAIHKLMKYDVSGAPVVSKGNVLEGMLSERDCMKLFASAAFSNSLFPRGLVAEYMVSDPERIDPHQDIFSVASIFMHRHYRRLPVVEGNAVIGVVSRSDILRSSVELWEFPAGRKWTDATYLTEDLKKALE